MGSAAVTRRAGQDSLFESILAGVTTRACDTAYLAGANHRSANLLRKLDVTNRVEAGWIGRAHGLG
jgi:hypothetical protein